MSKEAGEVELPLKNNKSTEIKGQDQQRPARTASPLHMYHTYS